MLIVPKIHYSRFGKRYVIPDLAVWMVPSVFICHIFHVSEFVVLVCSFTTGNTDDSTCDGDQLNIFVVTCNMYLYFSTSIPVLKVTFRLNWLLFLYISTLDTNLSLKSCDILYTTPFSKKADPETRYPPPRGLGDQRHDLVFG